MPQEHPVKQVSPAEALASSETIDGGPLSDNQSQSPAISSRGSPQPHDSTIDCPEPPQEMEEVIPPSVSDAQQIPKEPATPDPQEMSSARSSSVTSRLSRSTSPTPTRAAQARSEQQQQTLAEEIAAAASSGNVENSRSPTIEYATNTHALSTTESPQLAAETDESHEGADGENKSEYAEMDWDDLERRFEEQMKECREKEKSLKKEWDQWVELFHAWSEAGARRDEERARKRLKTRIAHVQISEHKLAEQKAHYKKVLSAFQSALSLLGNDADDSD